MSAPLTTVGTRPLGDFLWPWGAALLASVIVAVVLIKLRHRVPKGWWLGGLVLAVLAAMGSLSIMGAYLAAGRPFQLGNEASDQAGDAIDWPPFTMVYEADGSAVSADGRSFVIREVLVCFRDECDENAEGLMYRHESGGEWVFANDSRDFPLRNNDAFIVRELRIDDVRR